MLMSAPIPPTNGVFDGNSRQRDGWSSFDIGAPWLFENITLGIGDPVSGPKFVVLSAEPKEPVAPGTPDPVYSEEMRKGGTHWHRTDQWRIQWHPDQHFYIGNEQYHYGEYYLQNAITPYFDPAGATGMTMLQFDADRRGSIGTTNDIKNLRGEEYSTSMPEIMFDLNMTTPQTAHDDDAKALRGNSISTGVDIPRAGLKGSVFDATGWTELSDGSKVCVMGQSDPVAGPVIILSHNAPGAVEAPAGTYGSDMIRAIVQGSCTVSGRTMSADDFRAVEAGVSESEVVHGDEGSIQILYFADRRGWRSSGSGDGDTRAAEIAALIA